MKNMKKLSLLLTTCILGLQGCGPTEPDKRNITLQFSSKNFGLQPSAAPQSPKEFKPIYIYLKITDKNKPDEKPLYEGVVNLGVVGSTDNPYLGSNAKITLDSVDEKIEELEVRGKVIAVGVFDDETLCRTEQGAPPYDITNIARRFYQYNFMDAPIDVPLNTPSDSSSFTDDGTANVKNVPLNFLMKEALNKFAFKLTDTDGTPTNSDAIVELFDPDSQQSVVSPCTGKPYTANADDYGRVTVNLPVAFDENTTHNFQVKANLTKTNNDGESPIVTMTTKFFDLAKIYQSYKSDNHPIPVSCNYSNGTTINVVNNDQMQTPIFWKLSLASENYDKDSTTPMELNSTSDDPNDPNSSYLNENEIPQSSTSVCSTIQPNQGQSTRNPFNPRFGDITYSYYTNGYDMSKLTPTIFTTSAIPVVVNKAAANYQLFNEDLITIEGYDSNPNPDNSSYDNSSYDNSFKASRGLVVKCIIVDQVLKDDGKPFNDSPINIRGEIDLTQGGANISKSTFYDCTQLLKNKGPDLIGLKNSIGRDQSKSIDMIYYFTDKEGYDLYSNLPPNNFYTWDKLLSPGGTPRYPSSINPYVIQFGSGKS